MFNLDFKICISQAIRLTVAVGKFKVTVKQKLKNNASLSFNSEKPANFVRGEGKVITDIEDFLENFFGH